MNRASLLYVLAIILSALMLWGVLELGRNLTPPEDLSGKWRLSPAEDNTPLFGSTVDIEQSGRFFQLTFDRGLLMKLKLVNQIGKHDPAAAALFELKGNPWQVTATRQPGGGELLLQISGPQSGKLLAVPLKNTVSGDRRAEAEKKPDAVANAPLEPAAGGRQ